MAGIRTLEKGFDKHVKTYSSEDKVLAAVKKYTDRISGVVNVRIVPVDAGQVSGKIEHMCPQPSHVLRYTAIFSCFSEEGDIFALARAGCPFLMHR